MKTIVKLFQERFVAPILTGVKRSTIRNTPKRLEDWPEPGDLIDARQWGGRPYGLPPRQICELLVNRVSPITIDLCQMPIDYRENLACLEGFKDWDEMRMWFWHNFYPLPFTGIQIEWDRPTTGIQSELDKPT